MPAPRTPPGGTRGTVFREIARMRLADAASLLDRGRYNGAIYLAGYAIECYLKFAVCERKELIHLPSQYETHRWEVLVAAAGLDRVLRLERLIFDVYAGLIQLWEPALRYRTRAYPPTEAARLYTAMEDLYLFLREAVP